MDILAGRPENPDGGSARRREPTANRIPSTTHRLQVKRATNRHDVQFDCAQAAGAAPEHTEPRLPIDGFVSLPIEPRYARSHAHFPNPGDPCAPRLEATDMPALFVQVNIEARTVAASSGIQALWRSTRPAVGAPWAAQPPQGEPRVKTWRRRIILMVQAGAVAVAVTVTVKGTPVCAPPAAQPQPSRLPFTARASLRLHLCHRSRRGDPGAPRHRVRAPSAARAAGARSTRDLRRGADHPSSASGGATTFFR